MIQWTLTEDLKSKQWKWTWTWAARHLHGNGAAPSEEEALRSMTKQIEAYAELHKTLLNVMAA